jgi:hypothetical protein
MEPIGPKQLSPLKSEKHAGAGDGAAGDVMVLVNDDATVAGIMLTEVGALLWAAARAGLATAAGDGALLCPTTDEATVGAATETGPL